MTAHPDKGGSEAKMAAVNEAYEVLSNPGTSHALAYILPFMAHFTLAELRQRFDNGDDPNDPMAGQGGFPGGFPGGFGGGAPFQQFFAGDGANFAFRFGGPSAGHGHTGRGPRSPFF